MKCKVNKTRLCLRLKTVLLWLYCIFISSYIWKSDHANNYNFNRDKLTKTWLFLRRLKKTIYRQLLMYSECNATFTVSCSYKKRQYTWPLPIWDRRHQGVAVQRLGLKEGWVGSGWMRPLRLMQQSVHRLDPLGVHGESGITSWD